MTTPIMHMDCDGFTDAFADYLEGEAPEAVRAALDAHAAGCASCRALIEDVNLIRGEAALLPALTPSRDLWNGIAERIDARVLAIDPARRVVVSPRRRAWYLPALAAAALVAVTAGVTHYWTRAALESRWRVVAAVPAATTRQAQPEPNAEISSTVTERPAGTPARLASARGTRAVSAQTTMGNEERMFDSEIAKLRRIMRNRRGDLDPKTVVVLEQSMAVIDSAIAQSRAALASDPASGFLATQLNRSLEKKVELLRTAVSLPART